MQICTKCSNKIAFTMTTHISTDEKNTAVTFHAFQLLNIKNESYSERRAAFPTRDMKQVFLQIKRYESGIPADQEI